MNRSEKSRWKENKTKQTHAPDRRDQIKSNQWTMKTAINVVARTKIMNDDNNNKQGQPHQCNPGKTTPEQGGGEGRGGLVIASRWKEVIVRTPKVGPKDKIRWAFVWHSLPSPINRGDRELSQAVGSFAASPVTKYDRFSPYVDRMTEERIGEGEFWIWSKAEIQSLKSTTEGEMGRGKKKEKSEDVSK